MYALGIDSGTQGTKALVVEIATGEVRGRGHAPHVMIGGLEAGASEQAPDSWILALNKAMVEALKASGIDPQEIVSLGKTAVP